MKKLLPSGSPFGSRLAAGALLLALLIGLLALALAADAMLLAMVATAAEVPPPPAELHRLAGEEIAIYDLAGEARLEPGSGPEVIVTVTRGGRDAGRLRVATGRIANIQTLRVTYPGNRVVYGAHGGSSNLRVRDDGTFGDEGLREWFGPGRRVTIAGRGPGVEAHADLAIQVPRGRHLTLHLAVGRAQITNVDGRIAVVAACADVAASGSRGELSIDTGSGGIEVTGAQGRIVLDTGSGDIRVSGIGGELAMDTGSGSIVGSRLSLERLSADTGSGDIELSSVSTSRVNLDTGSGSVLLSLTDDVSEVNVDTGSGDITLRIPPALGATLRVETGSGGVRTDVPLRLLRRDGDTLEGVIGDGRGRIALETGSGSIRLLGP